MYKLPIQCKFIQLQVPVEALYILCILFSSQFYGLAIIIQMLERVLSFT